MNNVLWLTSVLLFANVDAAALEAGRLHSVSAGSGESKVVLHTKYCRE